MSSQALRLVQTAALRQADARSRDPGLKPPPAAQHVRLIHIPMGKVQIAARSNAFAMAVAIFTRLPETDRDNGAVEYEAIRT